MLFTFLKNHPFAVEAFFESSLVLTYAVPKEDLALLIPSCLELDTFQEKWAFVAIAIVKTKNLRPKGFPKFLGKDFNLTGHRIFVRYTSSKGKRLRGLYILNSETNKILMSLFGNVFTHYKYRTTDISITQHSNHILVSSAKSDVNIQVKLNENQSKLPPQSPFKEWKSARRFAGPLPYTFTYNALKNEMLIIEGIRENWIPQPVEVISDNVGFLLQSGFENAVLANAFLVQNIPYVWEKGKIDKCNQ
jgi:hypothetical protein